MTIPSSLHLLVDRMVFLKAIQAADAIVPSNSTKPIVTKLLIRGSSENRHIEIIATDLNVGLRCMIPDADVRQSGEIVVDARQITMILRETQSPAVTLRMTHQGEQHHVDITLADGEYQIQAVVGETFPEIQKHPDAISGIVIPGARLDDMLRLTTFAMDKDKGSPILSGLYVHVQNDEFIMTATDGKVLAEAIDRSERYAVAESIPSMVIPASTISHLQRILSADTPAKVTLTPIGKVLFIRIEQSDGLRIELTSRLIEGSFPSYRAAIAVAPGAMTATFRTRDLDIAVRRAALMTNQGTRGIIMNLEKNRAIFSNLNYSNGSARIPIETTFTGNPMRQGFNSTYVIDVMKVYQQEQVVMEFGRGIVMRQPGSTFLIMPITLPN